MLSVMKKLEQNKVNGNARKGRRGSVLMEYVLVQVFVACALMLFMNEWFYNWVTGSFVNTGLEVKDFYQRLLGGLSLPVP